VLIIDQGLVTNGLRTLALDTLSAYQRGVEVKWNDAELAIYLVYVFGEINKSETWRLSFLISPKLMVIPVPAGGKGRAAFCHAPPVAKESRKTTDYAAFPLTSHGEMLLALVQSGISGYPHRAVAMQFFETAARYGDFFKVRKDCILPTLEAMIHAR
jgi:exportin-T